jgi:CheY-like chemotaxis protein
MLETRQITLHCSICRNHKSFSLNMAQVRRLAEGRGMQLHCTYCSVQQMWQPSEPISLDEPEATSAAEAKRILLVDDDDLIVRLLQKVLESWEAEIETASNGKDALSKLASRHFDLMICDLQMSEMSGQELFAHVQDNALLPIERILFLTGDKRPEVKDFLDKSGCYFLYKPIQFLDFASQVQAVLANETRHQD